MIHIIYVGLFPGRNRFNIFIIMDTFLNYFFWKIISILPNLTVITSNVTRNYAGNYADFALQVIFEPYVR